MRHFSIQASWKARPETPEQVARCLKALLAMLRPITPKFEHWYQVIGEGNVPELDETENWLTEVAAAGVCTGDLGEPIPSLGYFLTTLNGPPKMPKAPGDVALHTHAGSTSVNSVQLLSSHQLDWDPTLVSYPVVKQTVLAFSRAFEPNWCEAAPFSLWQDMVMSRYKEGPVITRCWMIHLSPPLARRVDPPQDVISERYADGSLFLAVTDETFDPDNAEHVAAAHRLFTVLDTLQEKLPPEQWRY